MLVLEPGLPKGQTERKYRPTEEERNFPPFRFHDITEGLGARVCCLCTFADPRYQRKRITAVLFELI